MGIWKRWVARLADRLIRKVRTREPDFVIGAAGNPYMKRWWLIPRNRFFNIYLHHILRSDDDRALHDHPFANVSLLLRGGYLEITDMGHNWRDAGALIFRFPTTLHRLQLPAHGQAWSLFVTGPRVRVWGFDCGDRWVPWYDFVDPKNPGAIGPGCG